MSHQSPREKSPAGTEARRLFQPLLVGPCHLQTADDRFGSGASQTVRERELLTLALHAHGGAAIDLSSPPLSQASDSDEDTIQSGLPPTGDPLHRLVPTMQRFRNNLTVLSQLYNLYMVAYQGQIYVYAPRSVPKQTIPCRPDLILSPSASEAARSIGGYLDPIKPHTINHIVVGFLGQQEVVVACFDDGDVIAYYTRDIAESLSRQSRRSSTLSDSHLQPGRCAGDDDLPRKFFQENVGKSAWGLAVHQRSRLIAVSSNRHEVTVFAFALSDEEDARSLDGLDWRTAASCGKVEPYVRQRSRNWRIVISLESRADNLPNLSFVDEPDGSAELICAVDINGIMWLAHIWKASQAVLRISPSNCKRVENSAYPRASSWLGPPRGWGILAVPNADFVEVKSVEELLGMPEDELEMLPELVVSMATASQRTPENPCLPRPTTDPLSGLTMMPHPFLEAGFPPGVAFGFGQFWSDSDMSEAETDSDEGDDESQEEDEGAMIVDELSAGDGGDNGAMPINEYLAGPISFPSISQVHGPLQGWAAGQGGGESADTGPGTQTPMLSTETIANPTGPPSGSLQGTPAGPSPWTMMGVGEEGRESRKGSNGGLRQGKMPPERRDMAYFPHAGRVLELPREREKLVEFLKRPIEYNRNREVEGAAVERFAENHHVFRTFEEDLELRRWQARGDGRSRRELGVFCPHAVKMGQLISGPCRPLFQATKRLSMVTYVAELSLLLVGSPIGRVLLATPTRLATARQRQQGWLDYGFRIDWVLPRRSDEERFRKPPRPMHGMAVGPVPEREAEGDHDGGRWATRPQRFRLMLHYRNHDILTYEMMREEQTGKLCIF